MVGDQTFPTRDLDKLIQEKRDYILKYNRVPDLFCCYLPLKFPGPQRDAILEKLQSGRETSPTADQSVISVHESTINQQDRELRVKSRGPSFADEEEDEVVEVVDVTMQTAQRDSEQICRKHPLDHEPPLTGQNEEVSAENQTFLHKQPRRRKMDAEVLVSADSLLQESLQETSSGFHCVNLH